MTQKFATYDVSDGISYPVNANWWNTIWQDIDTRFDNIEDQNYTFDGVKTFSSIPVLPGSNPSSGNQATRKTYVDTQDDTKADTVHTHTESQITDLAHTPAVSALSDSTITGTPADNEVFAYDSGTGKWINQTAAEASLSSAGHTHTESEITDLAHTPDSHTHVESEISDLSHTPDSHTHTESEVTDLSHDAVKIQTRTVASTAPADDQVLGWNALSSQWEPKTVSGVSGVVTVAFKTIVISGQSDVVADDDEDTLTFVAGANMTLTTSGDTITFVASGSAGAVNDLTDVTITGTPADNEVFAYDSGTSKWINQTAAEAGLATSGHNHTFDALSNVTITSIASGEIPKWNGSAWINNTLAEAGIAAASHTHALVDDITFTSVTWVQPVAGTPIQDALTAGGAGSLVILAPGDYAEEVAFTANNQVIVGEGRHPAITVLTADNGTAIDGGAFTECHVHSVSIVGAMTEAHNLLVNSNNGTLHLDDCDLTLTVAGGESIAAAQPRIAQAAGTIQIEHGSVTYTHEGAATGGNNTKAAFKATAGGLIELSHMNPILVDCTGAGSITTLALDTSTGRVTINSCIITVQDDTATVKGFAEISGVATVSHEFTSNDLHVIAEGAGGSNDAYGLSLVSGATATVRLMYNHIHITAEGSGDTYTIIVAAGSAVSQFDDIVEVVNTGAVQGSSGSLTTMSSEADGELTLAKLTVGSKQIDAIHDEDNMVSDDEDGLATQQSIKAYVDATATGHGTSANLDDHTDVNAAVSDSDAQGDLIVRDATEWNRLAIGTNGHVLTSDGTDAAWAAASGGQTLYETVVAGSGGDYTTISAAVSAGKTRIFVRNGTYSESAYIDVPDNCFIIGESRDGVIIDWGANAVGFRVINDNTQYKVGTVALTTDDATLTGTGTFWAANVAVGDVIYVEPSGWVGVVASITDDTHLEFTQVYVGNGYAGAYYCAFTPRTGVIIKNMTMIGGDGSQSIRVENGYDCVFEDLIFTPNATPDTNDHGVYMRHAFLININRCLAKGLGTSGFTLTGTTPGGGVCTALCTVSNCVAHNCGYAGIQMANGVHQCRVINCTASANGQYGIITITVTDSYPHKPQWNQIIGCSAFANDLTGLWSSKGAENTWIGCNADSNGADWSNTAAGTVDSGNNV